MIIAIVLTVGVIIVLIAALCARKSTNTCVGGAGFLAASQLQANNPLTSPLAQLPGLSTPIAGVSSGISASPLVGGARRNSVRWVDEDGIAVY